MTARRRLLLRCALPAILLAGCGATKTLPDPPSTPKPDPPSMSAAACASTLAATFGTVARRVYHEGNSSTTQRLNVGLVRRSRALRAAVLADDPAAAVAAARALIATGHVSRLLVEAGGHVLADVGAGYALAPAHVTLRDAGGAPIGTALVSDQSASAFVDTVDNLTDGGASVRDGARVLAGDRRANGVALPAAGLARAHGTTYAVWSFPVRAFPSGTWHIVMLRSVANPRARCGSSALATVVEGIGRAATQIYRGEDSGATLRTQLQRVQTNGPLLAAVAARDATAARVAIDHLLTQHVVRIRVTVGGRVLVDVGGPFVLAPVTVPLRSAGRTIGEATVSIQDDLGFVLLARRLLHVHVVVRLPPSLTITPQEAKVVASSSLRIGGYRVTVIAGARPVMTTLGGAATIPASGPVTIAGSGYEAFTVDATAFPSGPLPIVVLIPIPYQ